MADNANSTAMLKYTYSGSENVLVNPPERTTILTLK